jgi:ABC-2 type transport system permease protein
VSGYWAVVSARYREQLQYRVAALAGAGTQFWWGFILIMVLEAFYRASDVEPPIGFTAAVAYIWLGQAFLGLLPWNHDLELEAMIRRGDVAYQLVRPLDLYGLWYARVIALRTARTTLRCLPIFLVAGLVLPITPLARWSLLGPASGEAALVFALAMTVAVLLSAAITSLVHVSLLWTISGDGLARVVPALVIVFSGGVIPLPLFPDWSQPLLAALPFAGLGDTPYRIYSGHIPVSEAGLPIAISVAWTVVLIGIGRALLTRGLKRVVVQGG